MAAAIAVSLIGCTVAEAATTSLRTTFLLSRSADGAIPDGPSRNPAVSHDARIARLMAYESDATNIVANDANGSTPDVFLVRRAPGWGQDGTPWVIGSTELVSVAADGGPANGASSLPQLDGDSHHAPHCVAFISAASNLVADDTNGVTDAFVRDLNTGTTVRVSVATDGAQANGPTTDVSIDGACERVAFTSTATNLARTAQAANSGKRAWRSARTSQTPGSTRQVYVRILAGEGHDRGFRGLTFLASASDKGQAANGDSYEPTISRAGKAVVFTSAATNLDRGDRSPGSDIYRRTFQRTFQHLGHGKGMQSLRFATDLVSATSSGRAGNGPSQHPQITDDARYVSYETVADNLLAGDSNGVSDIAEADMRGKHPTQTWVSKSAHTSIGNGGSFNPSMSDAGEFVLFESDATNLKPSASVRDDANGVRDVFLWNRPTGNVSLESRTSANGYLATPSSGPATSSRGNYVPFINQSAGLDLPLIAAIGAQADQQLVYVRYLGPK